MASRRIRREREGALAGLHPASQRVLVHVDEVVRSKLFGDKRAGPPHQPSIPANARPAIHPVTGKQLIDPRNGQPVWLVPVPAEEAAPPPQPELDPEVAAIVEAYLQPRALPLIEALEAAGATKDEQLTALGSLMAAAGEYVTTQRETLPALESQHEHDLEAAQ